MFDAKKTNNALLRTSEINTTGLVAEKMPGRGPRIAPIDFPIDQTVEEHRRGSSSDHACQHQ